MDRRWRCRLGGALALSAVLAGCDREQRDFSSEPPGAFTAPLVTMNTNQPGVTQPQPVVKAPYDDNAWAIGEGQRLYSWFNCVGCHAHGGGGMGPALMDDQWIYGSEPENIYATIAQGRPNGMPSFGGRINPQQIWQLVSYVRTLAGLTRLDARPARSDEMSTVPEPSLRERVPAPKRSQQNPPGAP